MQLLKHIEICLVKKGWTLVESHIDDSPLAHKHYKKSQQQAFFCITHLVCTVSFLSSNEEVDLPGCALYLSKDSTILTVLRMLDKFLDDIDRLNTEGYSTSNNPLGRPISVDGKRTNLYLDEHSRSIATEIGGGSMSDGVRIALEYAHKQSKSS